MQHSPHLKLVDVVDEALPTDQSNMEMCSIENHLETKVHQVVDSLKGPIS